MLFVVAFVGSYIHVYLFDMPFFATIVVNIFVFGIIGHILIRLQRNPFNFRKGIIPGRVPCG